MEISAAQHSFVRAVNDSNIHSIMMNTGAKIIFPDLSDTNIQQIKRSRVYVSGDINCVYNARQQLIVRFYLMSCNSTSILCLILITEFAFHISRDACLCA